jgi:ribosome biogenesis GTPase / thiamine phosphate phosphatase
MTTETTPDTLPGSPLNWPGLAAHGWTEAWQQKFQALTVAGLQPGRVVAEHRTHYVVATGTGEIRAETTGRFRNSVTVRTNLPGVGDFVGFRPAEGDGPGLIEAVLPRTSTMVRKAAAERRPQLLAANVDVVFIVTALDGDYNLRRIERYLVLVRDSGARPVIVLNKADLAAAAATGAAAAIDLPAVLAELHGVAPGIAIHAISARGRTGIGALAAYFDGGHTIALIGSSGVGKSTLTNQLLGRDAMATQEVRASDSRGRHTTTHREMFVRAGGGTLIDTPGLRELGLWDAEGGRETNFDDIETLALDCKFTNCQHQAEPGCAVQAAIRAGTLEVARLTSFATLGRTPERRGSR